MAILYRTHYQSRTLEEALIHKAIPYKIIGGIRFYERKEVKDLLAYLKIIVNPYDKMSLLRIINVPSRGLGEKFEEELLALWQQQPLLDFKQLIALMIASDTLSPTKTRAVQDFIKLYEKLNPADHPTVLLHSIIEHIAYFSYLSAAFETEEARAKQENVQELIQALSIFEQKQQSKPAQGTLLENFLHEVALLQESSESDENKHPGVLMMTLHAAKGLEFDTVILAGLEEGLLPSQRSLNAHEDLEEERRLMYVGMTRAKNHLIISSAHTRYTFGQLMDQAPSRFLQEIQNGLMQTLEIDGLPRFQTKAMLEQWLNGQAVTSAVRKPFRPAASNAPSIKKSPYAAQATSSFGPRPSNSPWYKNQTVKHQKFGTGLVTDVEKAPDNDFYVTALFKEGKKKILSKFLRSSYDVN